MRRHIAKATPMRALPIRGDGGGCERTQERSVVREVSERLWPPRSDWIGIASRAEPPTHIQREHTRTAK